MIPSNVQTQTQDYGKYKRLTQVQQKVNIKPRCNVWPPTSPTAAPYLLASQTLRMVPRADLYYLRQYNTQLVTC